MAKWRRWSHPDPDGQGPSSKQEDDDEEVLGGEGSRYNKTSARHVSGLTKDAHVHCHHTRRWPLGQISAWTNHPCPLLSPGHRKSFRIASTIDLAASGPEPAGLAPPPDMPYFSSSFFLLFFFSLSSSANVHPYPTTQLRYAGRWTAENYASFPLPLTFSHPFPFSPFTFYNIPRSRAHPQ